MESPGRKLRKLRQRLRLKYRDVEEASQEIARRRDNPEFSVGLSRLADIENRGTIPSFFRLYSLCAIYGLDFGEVLGWYGIQVGELTSDAAKLKLRETRSIDFAAGGQLPPDLPEDFKTLGTLTSTLYLSPLVKSWGRLPIAALRALDLKRNRYAFIGTDDWFMYPLIRPGSFVQIDEQNREIPKEVGADEHERPIHFLEHRDGFRFGWCTQNDGLLVVQPHLASRSLPQVLRMREVDVIGQVVGVAMRLNQARRHHTRF